MIFIKKSKRNIFSEFYINLNLNPVSKNGKKITNPQILGKKIYKWRI